MKRNERRNKIMHKRKTKMEDEMEEDDKKKMVRYLDMFAAS
jgi:hypothetical protein